MPERFYAELLHYESLQPLSRTYLPYVPRRGDFLDLQFSQVDDITVIVVNNIIPGGDSDLLRVRCVFCNNKESDPLEVRRKIIIESFR